MPCILVRFDFRVRGYVTLRACDGRQRKVGEPVGVCGICSGTGCSICGGGCELCVWQCGQLPLRNRLRPVLERAPDARGVTCVAWHCVEFLGGCCPGNFLRFSLIDKQLGAAPGPRVAVANKTCRVLRSSLAADYCLRPQQPGDAVNEVRESGLLCAVCPDGLPLCGDVCLCACAS